MISITLPRDSCSTLIFFRKLESLSTFPSTVLRNHLPGQAYRWVFYWDPSISSSIILILTKPWSHFVTGFSEIQLLQGNSEDCPLTKGQFCKWTRKTCGGPADRAGGWAQQDSPKYYQPSWSWRSISEGLVWVYTPPSLCSGSCEEIMIQVWHRHFFTPLIMIVIAENSGSQTFVVLLACSFFFSERNTMCFRLYTNTMYQFCSEDKKNQMPGKSPRPWHYFVRKFWLHFSSETWLYRWCVIRVIVCHRQICFNGIDWYDRVDIFFPSVVDLSFYDD